MKAKSHTGKTNWSWVDYESLLAGKQTLQVVEWPNGEGFTVNRNDETTIDIDWDEWDAIKLAVKTLGKET